MPSDQEMDAGIRRLQDNPAGRLFVLLRDAHGISGDIASKAAWCELLGVNEGDEATLMRRLSLAFSLPTEIRSEVAALPETDQELLLRWIPSVESAFQVPLVSPWRDFCGQIGEWVLYAAENCAEVLSRRAGEVIPSAADLNDLHERADELLNETLNADIPEDLRHFIAENLLNIDRAIQDVRLRGATALREAAEQAVGALVIRGDETGVDEQKKKRGSELVRRLGVIVASALMTLNLVNQGFELERHIVHELGPGQETPPSVQNP